jgi:hypothetical protein
MTRDPKRNPLAAKPPESYHRLRNESGFRRVLGRAPTPEDYQGIHTTDSKAVAAAYAISAWTLRGQDPDDFPVVIRLDTTGIDPLPDVDAMLSGRDLYDSIRGEVQAALSRGESAAQIEEDFEEFTLEPEVVGLIGTDPAAVIFDEVQMYPGNPISLLLEHGTGTDPVQRFATTGEVPPAALSEVVRQRRYMRDFDLDRVVGIDAVQPWWPEIVNEDDEGDIEKIRDAGWDAITFDDAASGTIRPKLKTIHGSPRGGESDYHGTTAAMVRAAFPGIRLGRGYRWQPLDSIKVKMRGAEVNEDDEEDA